MRGRFDKWLDPAPPLSRLLELVREPFDGPDEMQPFSTRVNSVRNNDPGILSPSWGLELFWPGGGNLSQLPQSMIFSTGGEIGVKRTSTVGTLANHPLTLVRLGKSMDYAYDW